MRSHKSIRAKWGYVIIFALLFAATDCSPQAEPTTVTATLSQTAIVLEARTSTASPTQVPPPTKPFTLQPSWVTDFALPWLESIEDRPADFEDNFDISSYVAVGPSSAPPCPLPDDMAPRTWVRAHWCGSTRGYIKNGQLVVTDCNVTRGDIYFRDFVMEFDGKPVTRTNDGQWGFWFRGSCQFKMHHYGYINVTCGQYQYTSGDRSFPGASYHVKFIAKGTHFALYLNEKPVLFFEDSDFQKGPFCFQGDSAGAIFDNFRIWDLTNISIP